MTNKSMSQSTPKFRRPAAGWLVVCGALAIFLSPGWATAQTIWDGGGPNNLFSNPDNWNNDIAPPNDGTDTLTLTGSIRTTPDVDMAWSLDTITFDAAATTDFMIAGNDITIANTAPITHNANADHTFESNLNLPFAGVVTLTSSDSSGLLIIDGDVQLDAITTLQTLTIDGAGDTTISGVISGLDSDMDALQKNGAGTLTLSGNNLFDGDTTVDDGTLVIDTDGSIAGNAIINGGTLTVNENGGVAGNVTVNNGGTFGFGHNTPVSGMITLEDGSAVQASDTSRIVPNTTNFDINGNIEFSGNQNLTIQSDLDLDANREFNVTNTGNTATTLAGVIDDGMGMSTTLTKNGAGKLILANANTYTGNTTLNDGTLGLGHDAALESTTDLIVNGGNLEPSLGNRTIPNDVTTNGDFGITGNQGQSLTLTGMLTLANGDRTVNVTNTGGTIIDGVITESGGTRAFTKTGSGTLTLNGVNSYTGDTTVDGGILLISSTGQVAGNVVTDSGFMVIDGNVAGNLTTIGGVTSVSGNVAMDATVNGGTVALDDTGAVSGNATVNGGTLTLNAANALTGNATVNTGGTLAYGIDSGLTGNLDFNGGSLEAVEGTRTISDTITISSVGMGFTGSENIIVTSAIDLTVNSIFTADNGSTATISAIIDELGGARVFTKEGGGTIELQGMNNYSGGTVINDGTLVIGTGGQILNNVTVDGGALDINNSNGVTGAATINSGGRVTLNAANALTGNATVATGGVLAYGINSGLTGNLIFDGGSLEAVGGTRTISDTITISSVGMGFTGSENIIVSSAIDLSADSIFTADNGSTATISGIIDELGGMRVFTKEGGGTIELQGMNTYSGGTVINDGTLVIGTAVKS